MARQNFHASVVILGRHGVLIAGPSGAGKTTLALDLIASWRAEGQFASLVADDQIWLSASNGRLIAHAPDEIAGLAEIRGFGPTATPHEPAAVIDLIVHLVEPENVPRFREPAFEALQRIELPRMDLSITPRGSAARAVTAYLRANGN